MNKLLALADRVEKLTGPDREVDLLVHNTLGVEYRWSWVHGAFDGPKDLAVEVEPEWVTFAIAEGAGAMDALWQPDVIAVPRYTASLDAAMTLVPEGLWAEGSLSSPGQLEVHGPCTYDPLGKGWAATPALALCTAALRARAHGGGEG